MRLGVAVGAALVLCACADEEARSRIAALEDELDANRARTRSIPALSASVASLSSAVSTIKSQLNEVERHTEGIGYVETSARWRRFSGLRSVKRSRLYRTDEPSHTTLSAIFHTGGRCIKKMAIGITTIENDTVTDLLFNKSVEFDSCQLLELPVPVAWDASATYWVLYMPTTSAVQREFNEAKAEAER